MASCLLVSDTSTELSYILPSEAAKKGAFERLFQVWGQGGAMVVLGEVVGPGPGPRRRGWMGWKRAGQVERAGAPPSGPLCCGPHPALSQHLECSLDTLHLSSFGLMDTTLEEVFLKVSEEEQSLENSEAGEALGPG